VTAPSVTLARAFGDLRSGWHQRELWAPLGWQDIRQRYRRSVLGPVWISITMAVTAIALGILYAGLLATTVVGWGLTLVVLRRYRARVAYWV
jgi:ABC-type polysaccharide/polyol phosphate export permease